jgi:hypothetical protein
VCSSDLWVAFYLQNRATFKKTGLNKRTALHEFAHHIIFSKRLELADMMEEKEANAFASRFLKS